MVLEFFQINYCYIEYYSHLMDGRGVGIGGARGAADEAIGLNGNANIISISAASFDVSPSSTIS